MSFKYPEIKTEGNAPNTIRTGNDGTHSVLHLNF